MRTSELTALADIMPEVWAEIVANATGDNPAEPEKEGSIECEPVTSVESAHGLG